MRISAHTRTFCDKHNDYCGPRSLRQLRDSSTALCTMHGANRRGRKRVDQFLKYAVSFNHEGLR